jgi:hypothetical protein
MKQARFAATVFILMVISLTPGFLVTGLGLTSFLVFAIACGLGALVSALVYRKMHQEKQNTRRVIRPIAVPVRVPHKHLYG